MKYFLLILLMCLRVAQAQIAPAINDCGTKAPAIDKTPSARLVQQSRLQYTTPYLFKVFIHLCADDNGASLAVTNAAAFQQYLAGTRQFYANSNICFLLMGMDTIKSTTINYMLIDNAVDYNTLTARLVPGCMNIFFHTTLADAGTSYNGYAYDIPNNFCSIRGSLVGTTNTSTLAHEMGHDFGLYHTFETQFGTETVPRNGVQSNCTTAGDLLCDTQADPNGGSATINVSCIYTGSATDTYGNAYNPPVRNLMTYGRFECRNLFTTGQNSRMESFIITSPKLTPAIAEDNYTYTGNGTFLTGTFLWGARTNVTIAPTSSHVGGGSSKTYASAGNSITLKPGVTLQPNSIGLADLHINTLCQ